MFPDDPDYDYKEDEEVVSWDWRKQPPWDKINALLRPYDVTIEEVHTGDDQYAVRLGYPPLH